MLLEKAEDYFSISHRLSEAPTCHFPLPFRNGITRININTWSEVVLLSHLQAQSIFNFSAIYKTFPALVVTPMGDLERSSAFILREGNIHSYPLNKQKPTLVVTKDTLAFSFLFFFF